MNITKTLLPVRVNPYKHQLNAFNYVLRKFMQGECISSSSGAALLMEMGTGKTLTTIAVLGAMYKSGKIKRVIIVAPLSIVGMWQEELRKFADFDYMAMICLEYA